MDVLHAFASTCPSAASCIRAKTSPHARRDEQAYSIPENWQVQHPWATAAFPLVIRVLDLDGKPKSLQYLQVP